MRFQPGTVASLDLRPILDRVLVHTNVLNTYAFDEQRPYMCEEVVGDSSFWLALSRAPAKMKNPRSILVTTPYATMALQDPRTRLEIPNRLIRAVHRPAVCPSALAVDPATVLRDVREYRAAHPGPDAQVCRRACDAPTQAGDT